MKFYETHFDEYINKESLHPKQSILYARFPNKLNSLKNLVFFGPAGIGKYTQMLKAIQQYSPSGLKYEKKISIMYNKVPYFIKISDIHYEVDMSILGCNSKLLWHEIYLQIIDIISAKQEKNGIIVCKNYHDIHGELLGNFYSYMQKNHEISVDLKFILITEELSFIPDTILNCCEVINFSRPTKTAYEKCTDKNISIDVENITNIKLILSDGLELSIPYKIICNKIISQMKNVEQLNFLKFRDVLYDIMIYNLDVSDCVFYILNTLYKQGLYDNDKLCIIMTKTYEFFQYYNNNYRPIYHLEKYFLFLISVIHKY